LVLYLFPALPLLALLAAEGLTVVLNSAPRVKAAAALALVVATLLGWQQVRVRFGERDRRSYSLLPPLREVEMARIQELAVLKRVGPIVQPLLGEDDTLYGAPVLVTALALSLDRRVSGEMADLAPRWIQLGLVTRQSVIERIEADRVKVLVTPSGSMDKDPVFREYLSRCFGPPTSFSRATEGEGTGIPRVNLYVRLDAQCAPP
jgi:hypothetical protein